MSPKVAFFAAFEVLMREGLEAVLIILTILGVIRATASRVAAAALHGAWIAAIAFGFLAWTFSYLDIFWLGYGRQRCRPLTQGITSTFAMAVLLYVGFGFINNLKLGFGDSFSKSKLNGFSLEKFDRPGRYLVLCRISGSF